jgi:sodium transport system permease protein
MRHAWWVFLKELRDALRDRRTLRAVLLSAVLPGPLMLGLISMQVDDMERHVESRELVVQGIAHAPSLRNFAERQGWTVREASADHEAALRAKRQGEPVLRVPDGFEAAMLHGEQPHLQLVSDSANSRASQAQRRVQDLVQGWLRERATLELVLRGVSPSVLQPATVDPVDPAARGATLMSMLPFMVLMAVVSGALGAALDSTAGERERGSLEPLLMNPAPRGAVVAGKWAAVALVGMAIAVLSCLSFLPGQWLLRSDQLAAMFRFGWQEAGAFVLLLLPLAGLLAAAMMAIAIRCRSVKEAQASATLLVLAVSLLPVVSMLNQTGEKPWQLWLPVVAQSTLMTRVLKAETITTGDIALPALVCAGLTVAVLTWVARQLGRVVAR